MWQKGSFILCNESLPKARINRKLYSVHGSLYLIHAKFLLMFLVIYYTFPHVSLPFPSLYPEGKCLNLFNVHRNFNNAWTSNSCTWCYVMCINLFLNFYSYTVPLRFFHIYIHTYIYSKLLQDIEMCIRILALPLIHLVPLNESSSFFVSVFLLEKRGEQGELN